MPAFQSRLSPASAAFEKNRADMLALIEEMRGLEARAVDASNKRRATFEKRNQLPPYDRVNRILDPGMPFLRLHNLTNYLLEDQNPETSVPGGSLILGIGFIRGVRCMIWVDDSGIKAGAATRGGGASIMNIQKMALRHKLPLIHLVESAGANLMEYAVEGWAQGGALFYNLAKLSAAGVPVISVLHGPSTAGGAYMPGLSDYVIGVKNNGMAALAGAALVRAATGEIADERELGGSEMHASTSGLVEYLAEDDAHALSMLRDVVGRLNWNARLSPISRQDYQEPLLDIDELAGVTPADYRTPYDVREVLARIVDGSDFEEFKPRYGASTVCVQASVMGLACAFIGNNGPIDPAGATKVAQFIQLCEQADLPIIFLHNTTGYMVGTEYEQAGMIKHGSKMIQAVSNADVPKITFYIGASFGAGNYGMCGLGYDPDFLFTWPNALTGVMGGEQAGKTMSEVAKSIAARKGIEIDPAQLEGQKAMLAAHFGRQESAFYTSGRNLDHGMIDPRDTRKVIGFTLETCLEARNRTVKPNNFGIARM